MNVRYTPGLGVGGGAVAWMVAPVGVVPICCVEDETYPPTATHALPLRPNPALHWYGQESVSPPWFVQYEFRGAGGGVGSRASDTGIIRRAARHMQSEMGMPIRIGERSVDICFIPLRRASFRVSAKSRPWPAYLK